MLTARIKIGDGPIKDSRDYGLVYLSSDNVVGAPIKAFEETSYPEQSGVNICPKTVDDAFDYTVTFFMQATSLEDANKRISSFNSLLYDKEATGDVKTFKQVEFYNDYKRHKIVGYPYPVSEAKEFWRDRKNMVNDVVTFEWKIRVNNPNLCDFSL